MFVLYALTAYCIICGTLLYVLLMGQDPKHRGGIVGRANACLRSIPSSCLYYCCLFGHGFSRRKAEEAQREAETYCMDKPNPFVQFFYSFLVSSALYVFYDTVAPQMPSAHDILVSLVVVLFSLSCYCMAWLSDPGTVVPRSELAKLTPQQQEAEARQNARFAADGTYFTGDADCATCNVPKPPRSKHCRVCNRCVRRFDHHCPWINTDVGENNLRWFHAFLLSHVVMSAMVAYWSGWVVWKYVERERLWHAQFARNNNNDPRKVHPDQVLQPSWWIVLLYAMSMNTMATALCLFAGIVALLLFGFWWMNFLHVLRNETTNEMHKREDIMHMIRREEYFDRQRNKYNEEKAQEEREQKEQQGQDQGTTTTSNNKKSRTPTPPPPLDQPPPSREDVERAKAFYNAASWWRNIVEVVMPGSAAANPGARGQLSAVRSSSSSTGGGGDREKGRGRKSK